MVTPRIHTWRSATWLCLAAAMLLALLPAGGVMVCSGHDGHVGFGVAAADDGCPCDHGAEIAQLETDAQPNVDDGRHPPCDDLAVDAPEVFNNAGFAQKLPASLGDPTDDDALTTSPSVWAPDAGWADRTPHRLHWTSATGVLPRQQLEHRRVVVLLI